MDSSATQILLDGVNFPTFRVTGLENIMNGVTLPTIPSVTGVSVDSLTQNVNVPSVPPVAPVAPDSSMNWLWILIIIPIGIVGAAAMSK